MNLKLIFQEGQSSFAQVFRQLIYTEHPEVFEQLDFYKDDHFMEPLLFGYFNKLKGMSIEQILQQYIQSDNNNSVTDYLGLAFFPGIGYYKTNTPNAPVALEEAAFTKVRTLEAHNNIEICHYSNPYYTYFLRENGAEEEDACFVDIPQQGARYISYINEAFELIKAFCPDEYEMYTNSTRRILLYENANIRSFVTRQVHGTIFLSVNSASKTGFFIEELIHQCSHNVFNAIVGDVKNYLKVLPATSLAELNGENPKREVRDIFGAFHGVYTVSTGVNSILPMVLSNQLDEALHFEMLGRLAIKKPRFRTGIERVNFDEVYTEKGKELYHFLDTRCEEQIQKHPDIFGVYQFSNQGSVFSFERFKAINDPKILS